jgi:hypothetical protein
MTKPFSVIFKSAFAILFVCSAVPVFAQHGGGGHVGGGGGFHGGGGGGGGFHGGGGSHSGGGGGAHGGSFSPPASGYGAPRASAPSAPRSAGGFTARPGTSFSRPGGNFAGGNQRFGNSPSAPPSVADGQWHSFGGPGSNRGTSNERSEPAPSNGSAGFHVFSGNRGGAGSTGAVRSFSGQGGEIWENAQAARNMVPKSQSLSSIHNSFTGSRSTGSGLRSNSTLSDSSRLATGSTFVGNRGFSGGLNAANSFRQPSGSHRFGLPHGGPHGGCWNCGNGFGGWHNRWGWGFGAGWGFGGGWGFGSSWFGFWGWSPFIYDPWWGWPAPGYGNYGSTNNYDIYNYPDSGYSAPDDNSMPPSQPDNPDDQENLDGNWVTPNGPNPATSQSFRSLAVPVLIYMKSGAVHTVRDYWMVDGELHYILMNGVQYSVDLELVDLSRTNTENAKSGVRFIFKSEPSPSSEAPVPAPTQEINSVPQPEART